MEKKSSLKEDHEETKMAPGDVENRSPVSEVVCTTGPLRAVVEERTVSFKLGDLEEAPERERLPMDLKEETSIDSSINGELTVQGFLVPRGSGKAAILADALCIEYCLFGLG